MCVQVRHYAVFSQFNKAEAHHTLGIQSYLLRYGDSRHCYVGSVRLVPRSERPPRDLVAKRVPHHVQRCIRMTHDDIPPKKAQRRNCLWSGASAGVPNVATRSCRSSPCRRSLRHDRGRKERRRFDVALGVCVVQRLECPTSTSMKEIPSFAKEGSVKIHQNSTSLQEHENQINKRPPPRSNWRVRRLRSWKFAWLRREEVRSVARGGETTPGCAGCGEIHTQTLHGEESRLLEVKVVGGRFGGSNYRT